MPLWLWAVLLTLALSFPAALISVMAVVVGIVPQHVTTTSRSAWLMPRSGSCEFIEA
jgi:hypothetical protein